jgi:hypothetical protein
VTPTTEKPKYGGTFNFWLQNAPTTFDDALVVSASALTNEELLTGDWTRGPAGTGEAAFTSG